MKHPLKHPIGPLAAALLLLLWTALSAEEPKYRSPNHLVVSPDGRFAYAVNQTADSISVLDIRARTAIDEMPVGPRPSHADISPDGRLLYVSNQYGDRVEVVNLKDRRVVRALEAEHEPYGVTLSPDGKKLYVAESISDTVSIFDTRNGKRLSRAHSGRGPRFIARTSDGSKLLVSNGMSRDVSIFAAESGKLLETRGLGKGALPRQITLSSDGKWAFVVHLISHDEQVPTQPERGRIHSNGVSVLALDRPGHRVTLCLDKLLAGAANPWGAAVSPDGSRLYVTLAGVHEVAIVDLKKTLAIVNETSPDKVSILEEDVELLEKRGFARRVTAGGIGPRGAAFSPATGEILVANYFSDTVSVLDAETGAVRAVIPLGKPVPMTTWRKGEMLFNDARIGFQHWFSCASCHQEDATTDGLNWDRTNGWGGNTKNVKSLHDINDTPPAMWHGVREDMDAAVQSGQRFLGFLPDPENHKALLAFIGNPKRAPNPYGKDRYKGPRERGRTHFYNARCDACHPPPLFTDQKPHDLGFGKPSDRTPRFDTPTLREVYRTAPYLHDGRARTLKELFTLHNGDGLHGETRGFSDSEVDELVAYIKSL